jgi:hypothetical protein
MPCETGKYRTGNPFLNCTGNTQKCPCAAASAETEQGKISVTSSQYGNQQKCEWIIQGGSGITLRINMVDTEDKYDFLRVYGCTSPSCHMPQELAVFSGLHSPIAGEADYVWPNYLKLVFTTDATVQGKGFEAEFRIHEPEACSTCPAHSNTTLVQRVYSSTSESLEPVVTSLVGSDSVYACKCGASSGIYQYRPSGGGLVEGFPGPDGGACCGDCRCHASCGLCKCDQVCNECRCAAGKELDYQRETSSPTPLTQGCPSQGACSCQTFTGYQGSLSDGSDEVLLTAGIEQRYDYRYEAGSRCRWIIAPPGVSSIRLHLHPGAAVTMDDIVTISECDDVSCSTKRTVGIFNGFLPMPDGVTRCDPSSARCKPPATPAISIIGSEIYDRAMYGRDFVSATGFLEVSFETHEPITQFSLGFQASWQSGVMMCYDCPSGKYKVQGVFDPLPTDQQDQCTPCPPHTDSPPGSSRLSHCMCKLGW